MRPAARGILAGTVKSLMRIAAKSNWTLISGILPALSIRFSFHRIAGPFRRPV
jgi:hypothetical protein